MPYYIYELVDGPAYPVLNKKQRQLAWITARSHLRRAGTELPDIICSFGAESSEEAVEEVVLAETGLKTPWIRYTLEEFAAKLNVTEPDDDSMQVEDKEPQPVAPPPQDLPLPNIALCAPPRIVTPEEELSAWGREQFAADVARQRGRPRAPLTCNVCKLEFSNYDAKYNHKRRGKCVPVDERT